MISYYAAGFNIQTWPHAQRACAPLILFCKKAKGAKENKQTIGVSWTRFENRVYRDLSIKYRCTNVIG